MKNENEMLKSSQPGWMGANNEEMEDVAADRSSQSAVESEDVSKRK